MRRHREKKAPHGMRRQRQERMAILKIRNNRDGKKGVPAWSQQGPDASKQRRRMVQSPGIKTAKRNELSSRP
jgi:hypothetical protein